MCVIFSFCIRMQHFCTATMICFVTVSRKRSSVAFVCIQAYCYRVFLW